MNVEAGQEIVVVVALVAVEPVSYWLDLQSGFHSSSVVGNAVVAAVVVVVEPLLC